MKLISSLFFLISLFFNCSALSFDTIQSEIKAIENGLTHDLQVKDKGLFLTNTPLGYIYITYDKD
jgi:hypothetical protein